MTRMLCGWTIGGLFLVTAMTHAGGWAVVTVTAPDTVVVGEPVTIRFAVRQHGQRLINGLTGRIEARLGATVISAPARPLEQDGNYAGTLTLPRSGAWTLAVVSGFLDSSGRGTVLALQPGEAAPALTPAAKGSRLFVSKGCATCHHPGRSSAPAVKKSGYEPDYLTEFLRRPPVRGEDEWGMPNLQLDDAEIASLVAYLNAARNVDSRPAAQ